MQIKSVVANWKKIPSEHTSILKALAVSLLSFFVLTLLTVVADSILIKVTTNKAVGALENKLLTDKKSFLEKGNLIAKNPLIIKYVRENDSYNLLATLIQEKNDNEIGFIGITNKSGEVITRTKVTSKRGDNLLLFSSIGRQLQVDGFATTSITRSTVDPTQEQIITARYIFDNQMIIGALFDGQFLNDNYAMSLNSILPKGVIVVFYTKEFGIYGTNAADHEIEKNLNTYFYPESEWISKGASNRFVNFSYNSKYFVKNIVNKDFDGQQTGELLLIPSYASAEFTQFSIVLITFLIYLVLSIFLHSHKKHSREIIRHYVFICFGIVVLAVILFISYLLLFTNYIRSKGEPYVLYNSTLRLQPESGIFSLEYENNISVLVNTGSEDINAVDLELKFDSKKISVEDISLVDSICEHIIQKGIDNDQGTLSLSCITENQGFNGSNGHVGDLIIKPRTSGSFNIEFNDDSKVLANDGLGTNVLRLTTSGSYQVESQLENLNSFSDMSWMTNKPVVFSPSHSNPSRWYPKSEASFVWSNTEQKTYAYAFDNKQNTVPKKENITLAKSITVNIPATGIYYFHLAPLYLGKLGPVTHYKIMSDLEPPSNLEIRASKTDVESGDVIHLVFSANDAASGLQKIFYLSVDKNLFYPVGAETYIPLIDPGVHTVRIRAYDKAGNYSEKQMEVKVVGSNLRELISTILNNTTNRGGEAAVFNSD